MVETHYLLGVRLLLLLLIPNLLTGWMWIAISFMSSHTLK